MCYVLYISGSIQSQSSDQNVPLSSHCFENLVSRPDHKHFTRASNIAQFIKVRRAMAILTENFSHLALSKSEVIECQINV